MQRLIIKSDNHANQRHGLPAWVSQESDNSKKRPGEIFNNVDRGQDREVAGLWRWMKLYIKLDTCSLLPEARAMFDSPVGDREAARKINLRAGVKAFAEATEGVFMFKFVLTSVVVLASASLANAQYRPEGNSSEDRVALDSQGPSYYMSCREGETEMFIEQAEGTDADSGMRPVFRVCHHGRFVAKSAPVKIRACREGAVEYVEVDQPAHQGDARVRMVCRHGKFRRG